MHFLVIWHSACSVPYSFIMTVFLHHDRQQVIHSTGLTARSLTPELPILSTCSDALALSTFLQNPLSRETPSTW